MFDKLVESTKSRQGRRAGRYFAVTTAIYSIALLALGIGAIIGFSPALAEEYDLMTTLIPPVPRDSSPPPMERTLRHSTTPAQPNIFAAPTRPAIDIPLPETVTSAPLLPYRPSFPDTGFIPGGGGFNGIPGSGKTNGPPAPPPPIEDKPSLKSDSTQESNPLGLTKVSEGVLQGKAIRKEKPVYPAIAKSVRAEGLVQVVVTISEEGRVIEANAVSGHPMLRPAATQAARQWIFSPTTLSGVPVKVQGVLSFNFMLQ